MDVRCHRPDRLLQAVAVALLVILAGGAEPAFAGEPLEVTLIDVNGKATHGRLAALDDRTITLAADASRTVDTAELVRLEFEPVWAPGAAYVSILRFANGDRLLAWATKIENGTLAAIWPPAPGSPVTSVPLETLDSVTIDAGSARTNGKLSAPAAEETVRGDLVVLDNGDQITGEVSQLDGTALALQTDGGERKIRRAQIRAIVMNPELVSFPQADGRRCLLTFADGTRLTGRNLQVTADGRIAFDALFGARMLAPPALVTSIRFLGGRIEYLSDLEPAEYEFTPYLAGHWPLGRDENVLGEPLLLRGREYAKGLGVHSRSVVRYQLEDQYRRFQAVAGIDDSAGGRGNVVFAVECDGVRVFTSQPVGGEDAPLTVGPIDVSNTRMLSLIVDYGQHADIQDRADWCDALLIK